MESAATGSLRRAFDDRNWIAGFIFVAGFVLSIQVDRTISEAAAQQLLERADRFGVAPGLAPGERALDHVEVGVAVGARGFPDRGELFEIALLVFRVVLVTDQCVVVQSARRNALAQCARRRGCVRGRPSDKRTRQGIS